MDKKLFLVALLILVQISYAGTISGKVVDERGEGLPGATIILDNTKIGAVASANGNFKIDSSYISQGYHFITVSMIGYEKVVTDRKYVYSDSLYFGTITLKEKPIELGEQVVIAYRDVQTQQEKERTVKAYSLVIKDGQRNFVFPDKYKVATGVYRSLFKQGETIEVYDGTQGIYTLPKDGGTETIRTVFYSSGTVAKRYTAYDINVDIYPRPVVQTVQQKVASGQIRVAKGLASTYSLGDEYVSIGGKFMNKDASKAACLDSTLAGSSDGYEDLLRTQGSLCTASPVKKSYCKDSTTLIMFTCANAQCQKPHETKCKQGEVCEYDENRIGRCENGVHSYCEDRKTLVTLKIKPDSVERIIEQCPQDVVCYEGKCRKEEGFSDIFPSFNKLRYDYGRLGVKDYSGYEGSGNKIPLDKMDYSQPFGQVQGAQRTMILLLIDAIERAVGKEYALITFSDYRARQSSISYEYFRGKGNSLGLGWQIEPILKDYIHLTELSITDRKEIHDAFQKVTSEDLYRYRPTKSEIHNDLMKIVPLLIKIKATEKKGNIEYKYIAPEDKEEPNGEVQRSIVIYLKEGGVVEASYITFLYGGSETSRMLRLEYQKYPDKHDKYVRVDLDPIATFDYTKGFINERTLIANVDISQSISIGEGIGRGGRMPPKGEYEEIKYLDANRYDVEAARGVESWILKKFLGALEESK